jgi:hypothetical protein
MKSQERTMRDLVAGSSRCAERLAHSELFPPPLRSAFLAVFCSLLSALCFGAWAQYAIDWHTIDGGGGTSTNGQYSVSGTIGQPDAGGRMTDGQYAVTGGFWALPQGVQTEGAPTLTIAKDAPGFANISWTPASTNWVLQESLDLSPAAWTNSPSGATNPVVVPVTVPVRFYRLYKP